MNESPSKGGVGAHGVAGCNNVGGSGFVFNVLYALRVPAFQGGGGCAVLVATGVKTGQGQQESETVELIGRDVDRVVTGVNLPRLYKPSEVSHGRR